MSAAVAKPGAGRDRYLLWAILALGLGLRIAGAQGALWLDEAWSAQFAHDTGTSLGVFLNINHDNNHHLNSLWLQLVGYDASPVLARGLSIVTGTVSIWLAWRIGARCSALLGLVTALLIAVSPIMVTFGSEARGYAPMLLALLIAILLTDRWLAGGPGRRDPAISLAVCFFLGALSHMTILLGFCAIAGWVAVTLFDAAGWRAAAIGSVRLLAPSAIALALVFGIVFGAAAASDTGFQLGSYEPFGWSPFLSALNEIIGYSFGLPSAGWWWPLALALLAALVWWRGLRRSVFYILAIIAFPGLVALLHLGNAGHSRYYLIVGFAGLLMAAEMIGAGFGRYGWPRIVAAAALALVVAGSLYRDIDLATNRRGDPGPAVRTMERLAPTGTFVFLDRDNAAPPLRIIAARDRYPLRIAARAVCGTPFIYSERNRGQTMLSAQSLCGHPYRPVARAYARGLSGMNWTLYALQR